MDKQKNQAPEKGLALAALAITFGFIWALGGVILLVMAFTSNVLDRGSASRIPNIVIGVLVTALGAAMFIWGMKKNRRFKQHLKQEELDNYVICPYCKNKIGKYIEAGTSAAASLSRGECPFCGRPVPFKI